MAETRHKHTAALEAAGINTVRATANSKGGTHNGTPGRLSDASEASVRLAFRVFVMRVSQTHARLSDASEASVRLALAGDRSFSEWQNMISALGAAERKRKQENNQNNQIYK